MQLERRVVRVEDGVGVLGAGSRAAVVAGEQGKDETDLLDKTQSRRRDLEIQRDQHAHSRPLPLPLPLAIQLLLHSREHPNNHLRPQPTAPSSSSPVPPLRPTFHRFSCTRILQLLAVNVPPPAPPHPPAAPSLCLRRLRQLCPFSLPSLPHDVLRTAGTDCVHEAKERHREQGSRARSRRSGRRRRCVLAFSLLPVFLSTLLTRSLQTP